MRLLQLKNNFLNIINALFLREIQTRFGSKKMGYFWAIVEPIVQISIFTFIHSLIGTTKAYNIVIFIAVGFLFFNLFRNIMTNCMNSFNANQALFNYRQVKPIHTIFSRVLVEFLVTSIVGLIFLFVGWYFNFEYEAQNVLNIILLVFWLMLFATSLGLLFATISSFYENVKKVVDIIRMPLMFTSAIFYSLSDIPQTARDLLLYNPVVHFMEAIHANYIEVLDDRYVSYTYMMLWTIIPLFLALFIYLKAERKIITT